MPDPAEPLLLTPGPLTTSRTTKQAMLKDWGSRDTAFIAMNSRMRARVVELAGGVGTHVAVPVQGSGTFAVEAMIGTFVPKSGKLLVLVNGAYGKRIARICEVIGRRFAVYETAEDTPPDLRAVAEMLTGDPDITHVAVVHCETTSGILNPVEKIAELVAKAGRRLLVDAMSAFGALPLDAQTTPYDALAASSNKCLEGAPGMGLVICRQSALEQTKGNAHSLALDLHDQWINMEKTKQWRFTPPTHVIAAFDQALAEHEAEGGIAGRGARYSRNCRVLVEGMRAMGFRTLLPDALQAPIIVTFHTPRDPKFVFEVFYDMLRTKGYVIYPGKLTVADSFRIGCIGRLNESDMKGALEAIRTTLAEMGVAALAPAAA
ncbi:MAG TPA: 2-aminoethylphosphonate--pyruvate transaminase [Alphaproteobacteria bacterium]|nr:2-aminoethylphosphonate--pyruvate transaminase [Alphaproteobacteria bacterium]